MAESSGKRRARAGLLTALGVAGVVAAGVAAERAYVRRDRKRPDRYRDEPYGAVRGTPIGPVASSDGTLIWVEEVGSGSPGIVLSHGFSLDLTLWHHQIKDLAGDARLILYDHRGHGRSARPPSDDWSHAALARDLDAVLRDATGDDPVVLVGHSMGGMTVLKYCELFPEQIGPKVAGLVLVATTSADVMGGMLPGVARRVEAGLQAMQQLALRALAGRADRLDVLRRRGSEIAYLGTRLMGFGPRPSPRQVAFVEELLGGTSSDVWLSLTPAILGFDVSEALPAIDVPSLVIAGRHDRLTPLDSARRIADALPQAELVIVDGAGHTPMLERHDEFNDHIRRFLARVHADALRR